MADRWVKRQLLPPGQTKDVQADVYGREPVLTVRLPRPVHVFIRKPCPCELVCLADWSWKTLEGFLGAEPHMQTTPLPLSFRLQTSFTSYSGPQSIIVNSRSTWSTC